MRYGILSDIHGNLEALGAVVDAVSADGVDAYLCLGDIVGYGADPNACCGRVRELGAVAVLGNHDQAAIGGLDLEWLNAYARAALRWTAAQLTPANRQFLAGLPENVCSDGVQLVHGSPAESLTGYVVDESDARAAFGAQDGPVCFIGHTHLPGAWAGRRGCLMAAAMPFGAGQPLALQDGCLYLVNCGSAGRPRDGNPDASCGVFDSDAGTVHLLRVPYDAAAAGAKIRSAGLPDWMADRLRVAR